MHSSWKERGTHANTGTSPQSEWLGSVKYWTLAVSPASRTLNRSQASPQTSIPYLARSPRQDTVGLALAPACSVAHRSGNDLGHGPTNHHPKCREPAVA